MQNLFLAIGPDSFQLKEFVDQYKAAALQKYGEFSVESFSLSDTDIKAIEASISAPSFFGGDEKRIIFLEGFPPEASPKLSEKKKDEYEKFLKTIDNLPDDVVLFCISANPDKRTKFFKTLKKNADKTYEHPLLDPKKDGRQIEEWIQKRAQKYGSKIDPHTASFLRSYSGNDLASLNSELQKLSTLRISSPITTTDITDLCAASEESADFAFSNAISSGKPEKILAEIETLVNQFDAAMIWNRDILSSIRTLLKAKYAKENPSEKSGIHPFVLKNLSGVLSKFNTQQLQQLHAMCTEIDIMTKNGKLQLSGDTRNFVLTVEKEMYSFFS